MPLTPEQIEFLEGFQKEFDEAYALPGESRPVREYAAEYAYIPDLFDRICSDLEIGKYGNDGNSTSAHRG